MCLCGLVLVGVSAGVGWAQSRPALVDQMGYADLVLMNGKIVSMDDRSITPETPGNIFQAMAIKGKKIMSRGTNEEMRALAGPQTVIENVGGRVVMTGLSGKIVYDNRSGNNLAKDVLPFRSGN